MIVCPYKDLGRYAPVIPGLEEAMKAIDAMTEWTPGTVPLSDGNRILVQEGVTKAKEEKLCEAHRKYLDVQYIVEGEETVGWAPLETLTLEGVQHGEGHRALRRSRGLYAHRRRVLLCGLPGGRPYARHPSGPAPCL